MASDHPAFIGGVSQRGVSSWLAHVHSSDDPAVYAMDHPLAVGGVSQRGVSSWLSQVALTG